MIGGVFLLPYTSIGELFGFVPLPFGFYGAVLGIVALYVASVEVAKRWFFKSLTYRKIIML